MTQPEPRRVRSFSMVLLFVGAVAVVAALFMLLVGMQPTNWWVMGVALGGGLLIILGVALDFPGVVGGLTSRQAGTGVYTFLSVLLALVVLGLVNFIVSRHPIKWDWTRQRQWTLSEQAREVLRGLDRDVTATVVYYPRTEDDMRNAELTRRLLQQFDDASERFTFEYVDLLSSPRDLEPAKKKFDIKDDQIPCVVFTAGDRKDVVSFESIFPYEPSMTAPQGYKQSYKGESRFASTLLTLRGRQTPVVYFTTGHGELSISRELLEIAEQIRSNFLEPRECPNLVNEPVPTDCAALFIIGPTSPFGPEELRRVSEYLSERHGSLYLGLGPGSDAGLTNLLGSYSVVPDNDVVVDLSTGRQSLLVQPVWDTNHEITRGVTGFSVPLYGCRSINVIPPPPGPMAQAPRPLVVLRAPESYGETDLQRLFREGVTEYKAESDIRRPEGLALAVAVDLAQRPPVNPYDPRPVPPPTGPASRILVVGSASYMVTSLTPFEPPPPGCVRFFFECVKWLAQTEEPVQVKPLSLEEPRLELLAGNESGRNLFFYGVVVGVPLLILVVGGVVWLFRRG